MSKIWQGQGSDKQQKEAKVEQKAAKRASSPRQKTLQDSQKAFTLLCVSALTQWHTADSLDAELTIQNYDMSNTLDIDLRIIISIE